jgi:hypothetical protein
MFLPVLHFLLLKYSRHLARFVLDQGFNLTEQTDLRFMETLFRFAREHLKYHPTLVLPQFFARGFAERKLILVTDLIQLCKEKNKELSKEKISKKKFK